MPQRLTLTTLALAAAAFASLPAFAQSARAGGETTDWSRPYAGLSLGAAGVGGYAEASGAADAEPEYSAVAIGGYAGATLFELGPRDGRGWLLGVELSAAALPGDDRVRDAALGQVELEGAWIADASLQLSYAWRKTRLFGSAGLAVTDLGLEAPGGESDDVALGLALGAGADYAIAPGWRTRLKASLYGFGEEDVRFTGGRRDVGIGASRLEIGVAREF